MSSLHMFLSNIVQFHENNQEQVSLILILFQFSEFNSQYLIKQNELNVLSEDCMTSLTFLGKGFKICVSRHFILQTQNLILFDLTFFVVAQEFLDKKHLFSWNS